MKQFVNKVIEFHTAFNHPVAKRPTLITKDRYELRFDMFREENEEFIDGSEENDIVEVVDAIGDMLYIICGTIVEHGLTEIEFANYLFNDSTATKTKPHTIPLDDSLAFFEKLRIANENYIKSCERGSIHDAITFINVIISQLSEIVQVHSLGGKIEAIFNEIHKSNMSKLGSDGKPIYREDGKILKGPKYFKPNLKDIINS